MCRSEHKPEEMGDLFNEAKMGSRVDGIQHPHKEAAPVRHQRNSGDFWAQVNVGESRTGSRNKTFRITGKFNP